MELIFLLPQHGGVFRAVPKRAVAHLLIVATFLLIAALLHYLHLASGNITSEGHQQEKIIDLLARGELASWDTRIRFGQKAPVDPKIVFLALDADSVSLSPLSGEAIAQSKPLSLMRAGYPFPREVYALTCDRLFSAGARAVAFDILFPSPKPEDSIWKQAIDRYRDGIVIAMNFSDTARNEASSLNLPSPSLFPGQDPLDERLGYVNYWKDEYGPVVRDAQYRTNLEHVNHAPEGAEKLPMVYSLAARVVQKSGGAAHVPNDLLGRPIRFAGTGIFPTFSLYQIFDEHSWEKTFRHGEYFRGKLVLIGSQGDWINDYVTTPMGQMNGAIFHLNAINALLQNQFLSPASPEATVAWTLAAALAAFFLALALPHIGYRFFAALAVFSGYVMALLWAYNSRGWLLPAVAPLTLFITATSSGYIYDFVSAQMEKFRLRTTFERYTSPNVAKYLLDHSESYKEMLAGTRQPVTVLFSDVRGFTTMSEQSDAHELVAKLNQYLTAMVSCVFRHDGSLDKFIGDAVMAVWGNTPHNFGAQGDAIRAVRAALEMLAELKRLNAQWLAAGKTAWQIGIGLNHGEVIVGDIGSQEQKEFAVLGDAVNLASRLESLTKIYQLELLIGKSVAELVHGEFHLQTVDLIQVVGKTKPVETFTVWGEKALSFPAEQLNFLKAYEQGIMAFRGRDFTRARDLFLHALSQQPGNFLAESYLSACEGYLSEPPPADWTGVRVMTKK